MVSLSFFESRANRWGNRNEGKKINDPAKILVSMACLLLQGHG